MDEKIQRICDFVTVRYRRDPNVFGIMLFGSAVRGKFDRFSDVDIYVLRKKVGRYSRENFVCEGRRVDVIIDTIKEAAAYLKNDAHNVRRNTSHMLAHGQVLYRHDQSLQKLQRQAKKNLQGKTKYTKSEILMHKYSINDFWGEVRRAYQQGMTVAFGMHAQFLLSNIIELFLKLKGEYFRQPNEIRSLLRQLDRRFVDLVEQYYKASSDRMRIELLSKLVQYIYRKAGGELPKQCHVGVQG